MEKRFSFSELHRSSGEVLDAALVAPVKLHKHGKDRLVLVTVEHFDALSKLRDEQRAAYTMDNLPDEHRALLLEGLEKLPDEE